MSASLPTILHCSSNVLSCTSRPALYALYTSRGLCYVLVLNVVLLTAILEHCLAWLEPESPLGLCRPAVRGYQCQIGVGGVHAVSGRGEKHAKRMATAEKILTASSSSSFCFDCSFLPSSVNVGDISAVPRRRCRFLQCEAASSLVPSEISAGIREAT